MVASTPRPHLLSFEAEEVACWGAVEAIVAYLELRRLTVCLSVSRQSPRNYFKKAIDITIRV